MARSSTVAKLPQPLVAVHPDEAVKVLRELIEKYQTDALVIGLPRDMHLRETDQTRRVRHWAEGLARHVHLPMYWQDETATSAKAESMLHGSRNFYKKEDIDMAAACLILHDFLQTPESRHVRVETGNV